jgi:hypothetical protein
MSSPALPTCALRSIQKPETVLRSTPAIRRAALFAQAGLWYDAVAAAETAALDHHAALIC